METSVTTDNDFKSLDRHNARQVPTICKTVKSPLCLVLLLDCICLQYRRQIFRALKSRNTCLAPATHVAHEGMCPLSCKDTNTHPQQGAQTKCWRTNIPTEPITFSILLENCKNKKKKIHRRPRLSIRLLLMMFIKFQSQSVALKHHKTRKTLNHNPVDHTNLFGKKKIFD